MYAVLKETKVGNFTKSEVLYDGLDYETALELEGSHLIQNIREDISYRIIKDCEGKLLTS